jgi:Fic-DOC domain mobile mystery protein B
VSVKLEFPEGTTPLDPNEIDGLIPSYISTQGQLNAAEQANILEAQNWLFNRKHRNLLSDAFIRALHRRMFQDVWRWAGVYRKTEKNIGIDAHQISTGVRNLCDDASIWISEKTFSWDEIGARFHHRLVSIHPFPNGNGRLSRLITDALLLNLGQQVFTWGANLSDSREQYIEALRAADKNRFEKLIRFVRSGT